MSHKRIRNKCVTYATHMYQLHMRMNAICRNVHMCKQYEIFTSYKIAKKDRYCWIVSLIQNRNCTSDAALVWVYPVFKVQVSFLE